MKKHKNLDPQKVLIATVWAMFALLLAATIFSFVIPLFNMLQSPGVMVRNAIVMMTSLGLSLLLPGIFAYLVGLYAVPYKSKTVRHFNSSLLALLAFALFMPISSLVALAVDVNDASLQVAVTNITPAFIVAVIFACLAVAYRRTGKYTKGGLIDYKPFSVLALVSIIGAPLSSLAVAGDVDMRALGSVAIMIGVMAAVGAIAYASFAGAKLSKLQRVTWSVIAAAVAWIAVFATSQFAYSLAPLILPDLATEQQNLHAVLAMGSCVLLWVGYLVLQVKSLKSKKR